MRINFRSGAHCAFAAFCRFCRSISVLVSERLICSSVLFTGKCENFAMITSFDLGNIYPGTPNFHLNPRPCAAFYSIELVRGGGSVGPPSRSAPDELRASRKNERIALNEREPMGPNFKVSGQLMTSEVRSNTQSGPPDMTVFRML